MELLWLGAVLFFSLFELITTGFVSIWFAAGSLAALIGTLFGGNIWVQLFLFTIATTASLLIARPLVKRYITPKIQPTNANRYIGKIVVCTTEINNISDTGTVKLGFETWTARSLAEQIIPVGAEVTINSIEGNKFLVTMVD